MSTVTPRISVITPSFNQGRYIETTVRSVLDQRYPDFHHIVMDGGSTDETATVLKSYPHVTFVSERDRGQADALHKGLKRIQGGVVGWLNSDDYYAPGTFAAVAECFSDPDVLWAVGNLAYVYESTGEIVSDRSPPISYEGLLRNPDIVRQAPTFFRWEALNAVGGWDASFHMTMDLDLWVRIARIAPPRMVDALWAHFRVHPQQKTSAANLRTQAREIARILKREGVPRSDIIAFRTVREWYLAKSRVKQALIGIGLIDPRYRHRPIRVRSA
jgi:glycosyltransferase involved in cell wall biosynthesis